MAITPTVVIAASGFVQGNGIDLNQTLQTYINAIKTNALSVTINKVKELGQESIIAALPDAALGAYDQAQAVLTHARAIFPEGASGFPAAGVQQFISTMGGASSFASAGAEFSAALQEFKGKTFSDLGIGVGNFRDVLLSGASGISQGFRQVADNAKQEIFGAVGNILDPAALTRGQALIQDSAVGDALKSVGSGLKDLGGLFDFRDLQTLGPRNMIRQLQKQGLADRNGVNDLLLAAGHDPNDISKVPENELQIILQTVRGEDLQKIVRENNLKLYGNVRTAADLLVAKNILSPNVTLALGLVAEAPDALSKLGNTLTNLGVEASNFQIGNFMEGLETKATQYLDQVTELIPQQVEEALRPIIGVGEGLFGNPLIKDMIGTVSGLTQNAELDKIGSLIQTLESTPDGQEFISAGEELELAQQTLDGMAPEDPLYPAAQQALQDALDRVEAAANGISSTVSASSVLDGLATAAKTALDTSVANIAKEVENLKLAGLQVVDGVMNTVNNFGETAEQVVSGAYNGVLSFANRLHQMGVDAQELGYGEFLENLVTDNLYGDAVLGSLIEGRNLVRAAVLGKSTPAVADEKGEIKGELEKLVVDQYNAYKELSAQYTAMPAGPEKLDFLNLVRAAEDAYRNTRNKLGPETADNVVRGELQTEPTFESLTDVFRL